VAQLVTEGNRFEANKGMARLDLNQRGKEKSQRVDRDFRNSKR
jgi:hypothetical protein